MRPVVGQERLRVSPEGQVVLDLRRRWADGTAQLAFDPVEFLERLAALVPRPRINLVLYYCVLAPCAARREGVVPSPANEGAGAPDAVSACGHDGRVGRRPNRAWAELMERSFGFDVLACPCCVGRTTLVALIRDPWSVVSCGIWGCRTRCPCRAPGVRLHYLGRTTLSPSGLLADEVTSQMTKCDRF
ncbi:MAG: transposase [Acidobacteria bacterium]|nr:transposase [Acidobacteriota bacterium]